MPDHHLVLGGARSGKSDFAEADALAMPGADRFVYIATAQAFDDAMAERIAHHRMMRGDRWQTVEAPRDLAAAITTHDGASTAILIDCLTLWLSNALANETWAAEREALIDTLASCRARVWLVSNEVGSGVVPMGALSRAFVDAAGRLHQDLAARCSRVTLVTAGLPLVLKDTASSG